MARVIFYEKPGCKNNTRQKVLLTAAGHEVISFSLLTEPWTVERLKSFFGDRPISEWFNKAAPRVKSGEVDPQKVDEQTALMMMLKDPLLIRRPLIEVGSRREVGFDVEKIDAWIGLKAVDESFKEMSENLMQQDLQGCAHGNHHHHHEQGKCNHH
ncbi:MAG TPA: ArsC/Spx/MgsR family protein [Nostocaceae cyanobacterium]|nr:ArsC/Spx/MgsR family protein [Nostocaceae cyanobacterium]